MNYIEIVNMGYSDNLVQILRVSIGKGNKEGKKCYKESIPKDNVNRFITILSSETFEEMYVQKGINETYKQFINKFCHYFHKVFPLKLIIKWDVKSNTWISEGIKRSSQKIRLSNNLKQKIALSTETLTYINRYQRIYKRLILEAKKRIMTNV
jgi:hypothetical protein